MTIVMGLSVMGILDLVVAGISFVIFLAVFAIIASILCCTAFFFHAKNLS